MELLKSRKAAVPIAVVIVLLSLCFGVHKSAGAKAKQVNRMFEIGTDQSGYGIAPDLLDRQENAAFLTRLAGRYDGMEPEIAAVQKALEAASAADTVGEKYDADQALEAAVSSLDLAMEAAQLSEADDGYRSSAKADFDSRHLTVIRETEKYNEQVRLYEESVLRTVPVRLFGWVFGLPAVEAFE